VLHFPTKRNAETVRPANLWGDKVTKTRSDFEESENFERKIKVRFAHSSATSQLHGSKSVGKCKWRPVLHFPTVRNAKTACPAELHEDKVPKITSVFEESDDFKSKNKGAFCLQLYGQATTRRRNRRHLRVGICTATGNQIVSNYNHARETGLTKSVET
jgi:hypothetical protein